MRGTEPEEQVAPAASVEEERSSGFLGMALLAALLLLLGLRGSWSMVWFVLAILVVIFLHELGHYLTAKWAGMKVTEFFIGFGPKLWSFRRGETEYGIKGIPAGAYVRIIGMSNLDEVDPADEDRTYRAQPYWRRLSVVLAGSTMHFLIAFVLILTVFMGFGVSQEDRWSLGTVTGPAEAAGLRADDRVLAIDGRPVSTFDDLAELVSPRPGETVELLVSRDGAERTIRAELAGEHPMTGERRGYLGVSPAYERVRLGPVDSVVEGVQEMGSAAKESVLGLGRLFSPSGISGYVDNLTGAQASSRIDDPGVATRPSSPVGLVQAGGQLADQGLVYAVTLLFFFNVFIGIFNLTPVLPFDGGHVAVATYEKIRSMISGRRYQADMAKLMPLTYVVVFVLALLFVTSLYLDIANPLDLG